MKTEADIRAALADWDKIASAYEAMEQVEHARMARQSARALRWALGEPENEGIVA